MYRRRINIFFLILIAIFISNKEINAEKSKTKKFHVHLMMENPIAFPLPPMPMISLELNRILFSSQEIGIKWGFASGMFLYLAEGPDHAVGIIANIAPTYKYKFDKDTYIGTAINIRYHNLINFGGFSYNNVRASYQTESWNIINAFYLGFKTGKGYLELGYGFEYYKKMKTKVDNFVDKIDYPLDIDERLLKEKNYWSNVLKYYQIHFTIKFF
ncbi:MAG: hypothetical protein OEZ22_14095 [Spirochaetia bacterium]|nr:hypothetical protein [Spirochaetia bacterium]